MIPSLSNLGPITTYFQRSFSSIWSTTKKVIISVKDLFLNVFQWFSCACNTAMGWLSNRLAPVPTKEQKTVPEHKSNEIRVRSIPEAVEDEEEICSPTSLEPLSPDVSGDVSL